MENYNTTTATTAAELNEMRVQIITEKKTAEKKAAELLEALRKAKFDLSEIKKTDAEYKAEQQKIARYDKILSILDNNYKIKVVDEIKPTICAILQKYTGKQYGEKTAQKIRDEIKAATGFYVYFKNGVFDRARDTLSLYSDNHLSLFEVCAELDSPFIDTANKILPPPEKWNIYGIRDYIENPDELIKHLDELREKALKIGKELRELCREFNSKTPQYYPDGELQPNLIY